MVAAERIRRFVDMYVRVVGFTDVSPARIDGLLARIKESGPPPEVRSTHLQFVVDEDQGTAVALQYFETAADMEAAAKVLGAIDPSETPGTRASVDMCEVKYEPTPS
jgi:hypothetical protein